MSDRPDTGTRWSMTDPWDAGLVFMFGFIAGLAVGGGVAVVTLVLS